jgi:Family of unknown function (DUF6152)
MRQLLAPAAALAILCAPVAASAHHSFAMFDTSKQVSVAGVIKDFQYTNPHSWVILTVAGADGKTTDWSFESEGPSTLLRAGIKRSSLPIGDKVTIKCFPMKDGRPAGALINVTKADGSVIVFRNGGPPPAGVTLPAAN